MRGLNDANHFLNDGGHFTGLSLSAHLYHKTKQDMETSINVLPVKNNAWTNLLAAADHQSEHNTIWFLFSLIFQGILILPIPAVLMYYYNASIIVLPITFGLYLANIVVGMGGSNIRVVLGFLTFSILVNIVMLALYIF